MAPAIQDASTAPPVQDAPTAPSAEHERTAAQTEDEPAAQAPPGPSPKPPPAPAEADICEIRWARVKGRSEFQAIAVRAEDGTEALVARSPGFRWRLPVSPDATPAATAAHEALVRQLLAAGWQSLGPGGVLHWYGDRFGARPRRRASPSPVAPPRLICEIKWVRVKGGRSEFQAIASRPQDSAAVLVGRSPSFRWLLPMSPDATPAAAAAHEALVRQLLGAGWKAFERGSLLHWYGERFRSPEPSARQTETEIDAGSDLRRSAG